MHGRGLQCTAEDYSARQRITVHGRGLQCTGRGLQCGDYSAQPGNAAGVAAGLGMEEHQSKVNLLQWIDQLIKRYSPKALQVQDQRGRPIPACHLKIQVSR